LTGSTFSNFILSKLCSKERPATSLQSLERSPKLREGIIRSEAHKQQQTGNERQFGMRVAVAKGRNEESWRILSCLSSRLVVVDVVLYDTTTTASGHAEQGNRACQICDSKLEISDSRAVKSKNPKVVDKDRQSAAIKTRI
jgi:hypothetical protein